VIANAIFISKEKEGSFTSPVAILLLNSNSLPKENPSPVY
jgi:hypothetical protein